MPDAKPAVTPKKRGGWKNWAILGVLGVGGYYAYQKFISPEIKTIESKPGKSTSGPDLNGPSVTKFEIASTRSNICIDKPVKGFSYAKVTSTNAATGYKTFSANVAGHFTRRLLCRGSQKYAEIAPLRTSIGA